MHQVWDSFRRLHQTLYFVPLILVAVAIFLAQLTTFVDHRVVDLADFPGLLSVSLNGGRAIAGAVAGATITVAAIVFSITALSSQIAATQYSPRAVAGFLEDNVQRVVIGIVVGTFAFSLQVLAELSGAPDPDIATKTSLSVTAVLVLGVTSAVAIVAYLDHSLRRMRIDAVVRRIAEATRSAVRRQHRRKQSDNDLESRQTPDSEPLRLEARWTGWVLSIDAGGLARRLPPNSLARVEVRVGEAVMAGDLIATLWTEEGDESHLRKRVEREIRLGRDRSIDTDPDYGIRQLVDIGLRALSPGVNDPTTAIDVVQHLKLPIREVLTLDPPRRVFTGPNRQRVFLPEARSRSDQVRGAFSEIRLAAAHQPAVLTILLEVMGDLITELEADDLVPRTAALRNEAAIALEAARSAGFSKSDLQPVLDAAEHLGLDQ